MICIWCKSDFPKLSKEHIIPEALGCPDEFILSDVACERCNNKLGTTVDVALIKQFEVQKFLLGIAGKRGKRPTVKSWAALNGCYEEGSPVLEINAGPNSVESSGKRLPAAGKGNGIYDAWVKPEEGRYGFKQEFGNAPLFLPALYKIGLNAIGYYLGTEVAASAAYDHVRSFVLRQTGAKPLTVAMEAPENHPIVCRVSGPIMKAGRSYPMFQVVIFGIYFLLDMDPDQRSLRDLRGAATMTDTPFFVF